MYCGSGHLQLLVAGMFRAGAIHLKPRVYTPATVTRRLDSNGAGNICSVCEHNKWNKLEVKKKQKKQNIFMYILICIFFKLKMENKILSQQL